MILFDELIFWINWCMAWLTTLGIWYCWFMALRIGFLGKLNYGISKYPIQDSVVDFLVFIRLIKQENKNKQPYVPKTFFGYQLNTLYCCLIMLAFAILVPFCYYSLSTYDIIIPQEHNITTNSLFNFIFKFNIKFMLSGVIGGFISIFIAIGMESRIEQNNLHDFGSFMTTFCLTSLVIGSSTIYGIDYLIDVVRYK